MDHIDCIHFNSKILTVNDHALRIAVNDNTTFKWHVHQQTGELFIVLEGNLVIEFEDSPAISLLPYDSYCIPAGIVHRTIAKGRTVNLCIEIDSDDTVFMG